MITSPSPVWWPCWPSSGPQGRPDRLRTHRPALARWGGWDIAEAAQAAPVILAAAAGGLTIFLQGLYEDGRYTEEAERHDV